MTGSRISTTVTHTVVLGSKHHASPLTITATGVIDVTQTYGANGIYGAAAGQEVINHGSVTAANGSYYSQTAVAGAGGIGIDLTAAGTISNSGTIAGGAGGSGGRQSIGGVGGNGIDQAGGRIVNSGTIEGGAAGYTGYHDPASQGGAGIDVTGAGLMLRNSGLIIGGSGVSGTAAYGGAGVHFAASGTLTNTGTIAGGSTQYGTGGTGVDLSAGGVLNNGGLILGVAGSVGLTAVGATTTNDGTITGGGGIEDNYFVNAGGAGVSLTGGTLNNHGLIAGGSGTYPFETYPATPGGVGVMDSGASLLNTGLIQGGTDYGREGVNDGVVLQSSATLTNHGTIIGGQGKYANGGNIYIHPSGGAGVLVDATALALNTGLIEGGSSVYFAASGGAGVIVSGGMLTNSGTIIGGAGGQYSPLYGAGYGGAGAQIKGGTLVTSGTITGGADTQGGAAGDAVDFLGSAAGTLVITASAVFGGNIVGNTAANDTLVLAGHGAGTLAGFGTAVTGLTTIVQDANTHWTLEGSIGGTGALSLGTGAFLDLSGGTVSIASIVFGAGGKETLYFGTPASVSSTLSGFGTGDRIVLANVAAQSLTYAHGTLTLLDANHNVVDTLAFAGKYTKADFSLQQQGHATAVVYAGSDAAAHLPDFIPQSPAHAAAPPVVTEPMHVHAPSWDGPPDVLAWLHQ